jgi:hypothetical protein
MPNPEVKSRYRKIETRIWNDSKFRSLSDNGKLALFLVLTHPHMTALGAMRATIAGLGEELHWGPDAIRDAMRHAMSLGLVEVDEQACYIGLPNFLRYNEPEGPNSVIKAWPQALELIPECSLKARLTARCRKYLDERSQEFKKAMGDAIWHAFAMPSDIQEQEQEQEQEENQQNHAARKTRSRSRVGTPVPEGLEVTDEHRVFARKHKLPNPDDEIGRFLDYWRARPGKEGLKLDWNATFRNWLRNASQFSRDHKGANHGNDRQQQSFDAIDVAAERMRARRVAQAANEGNEGSISKCHADA